MTNFGLQQHNLLSKSPQKMTKPVKFAAPAPPPQPPLVNNNFYQDEDEDEEKIVINMDELSLVSLEQETSVDESTQMIPIPNQKDAPIQQHVDYQFENDLKTLDQKIFKVKQMLDSMKSS